MQGSPGPRTENGVSPPRGDGDPLKSLGAAPAFLSLHTSSSQVLLPLVPLQSHPLSLVALTAALFHHHHESCTGLPPGPTQLMTAGPSSPPVSIAECWRERYCVQWRRMSWPRLTLPSPSLCHWHPVDAVRPLDGRLRHLLQICQKAHPWVSLSQPACSQSTLGTSG